MDEATQTLDGNGGQFQEGDGVERTGVEAPADGSPVEIAGGGSPDPTPAPTIPAGKLKVPDETNGHYVVLYAQKPKRGQKALYVELACVKAHDGAQAKRLVLGEDGRTPKPVEERSELARFLLAAAGVERGILLRAVPAMHWPGELEPTTYVRPEPVLQIG